MGALTVHVLGVHVDAGRIELLAVDDGSSHGTRGTQGAPDGVSLGSVDSVAGPGTKVERIHLAGDFAWRVHPVRRCVGQFDDAFRHVPCPTDEPVSIHRQCLPCSGLDDTECIFEPRCQDDPAACTCLTTFKGVPHVVYLAFHGTLPKVGLTTRRRLRRRLWEQGADAYLVLQETADRATARAIEKQVSYVYKVPEHRGHRETLPQLARPVPWPQIEARAEQMRLRFEGQFDLDRILHRVMDHPIAQPLGATPRRVPSEGKHRGTWIGAKGNHLVYREAPRHDRLQPGALAALKLNDLVGRRVEALPQDGG